MISRAKKNNRTTKANYNNYKQYTLKIILKKIQNYKNLTAKR